MAASDSTSSDSPVSPGAFAWPGAVELDERLHEEIGRAERHGTPLSCLLIVVDNLEEMAGEHGGELREQTLAYIAGALHRELRRFDRVGMPSDRELLIVLPGADGPHGEMVARRVLDRLRAIKVEARGKRQALRISVGLSAWRTESTAATLLRRARAAAERAGNGEAAHQHGPGAPLGGSGAPEPTSPPS
jgi:diguanylate cyclase (GGDEF)-like protein